VSRAEQARRDGGSEPASGRGSRRHFGAGSRSNTSRGSKRSSASAASKTTGGGGREVEGAREFAAAGGVTSPVLEGEEEGAAAWDDDDERVHGGEEGVGGQEDAEREQGVGLGDGRRDEGAASGAVGTEGRIRATMRALEWWRRAAGVFARPLRRLRGNSDAVDVEEGRGVGEGGGEEQEGVEQEQADASDGRAKVRSAKRPVTKATTATATTATGVQDWKHRNWTILVVTVVQCQELPRRAYRSALGQPVDATAEVSLGDIRYTIPAPIKRSCAPYFNETFAFQLPEPEDAEPEPEFVKIEIVDAGYRRKEGGVNKKRRRGDSLGITFVPIAGRGEESWRYLQNIKGEVTVGRVKVRTQRVILEGLKPHTYMCPQRERFRLDLLAVKSEQRRLRVGRLVADMIELEANKPKKPPTSRVMHPGGAARQELDSLVFFASVVTLLLSPMAICFDVQATYAEWVLVVATGCDAIFAADVFTRFRSGFQFLDAHGEWRVENRLRRCRAHYLDAWRLAEAVDAALAFLHKHHCLPIAPHRPAPRFRPLLPDPPKTAGGGRGRGVTRPAAGWFWLDAVTCFPAEVLLAMVRLPMDPWHRARTVARVGAARSFLRVMQGAKLLRLARVCGFLDVLQRSRSTRLAGTIVIKILLYSLLWLHWVACLWFAALRAASSTAASSALPANTTANFTTAPSPVLHEQQTVQGLGVVRASNATATIWWTCDDREKLLGGDASAGGRYLCALHWATQTMLAIGIGDVPLASSAERVLAIVAMPLGLAVAMTVAGAVGSLLPGAPTMQTAFVTRVRRVTSFLKIRALPKELRKDVQRFFESEWQATGGNDDIAMLRPLPLSLQVRSLRALHGHVIEAVPFLRLRLDDLRFWRILLKGLEQVSYAEGEWLIREGETSEYFFMIKMGQCELISERFEGQGLDEDGRPRNASPSLTKITSYGEHSPAPEWELLDWEEETRRLRDENDSNGVGVNKASPERASVEGAGDGSILVFSPPSPAGPAGARRRPRPLDPGHFGRVGSKPGQPHEISFDDSMQATQGAGGGVRAGEGMSQEAGDRGWGEGREGEVAGNGLVSVAPEDGPQGPDPRQASAGYGWKGVGPRPWWSPMALGRGTLSAWGRDKSVVTMDSRGNTPLVATGRSFWRPFSKGSPSSKRSAQQRQPYSPPDGSSVAGRSMLGGASLVSAPLTDSTGGTWAVPRPTFLSTAGLSLPSAYLRVPDFGPPPDWLPDTLYSYWPTGGVRGGRGDGGAGLGHGGGSTGMSMVSDTDLSATRSLSGTMSPTMSPTRSVVSLSGVSGHGRAPHHPAQAAKVPEEPPYVYGKYNTNSFFGDVAMSMGSVSLQAPCIALADPRADVFNIRTAGARTQPLPANPHASHTTDATSPLARFHSPSLPPSLPVRLLHYSLFPSIPLAEKALVAYGLLPYERQSTARCYASHGRRSRSWHASSLKTSDGRCMIWR